LGDRRCSWVFGFFYPGIILNKAGFGKLSIFFSYFSLLFWKGLNRPAGEPIRIADGQAVEWAPAMWKNALLPKEFKNSTFRTVSGTLLCLLIPAFSFFD
jgi:hypothetical protein